ncbi:hypothetical protein GGS24DRAFT_492865 [Hypoxylon argillaceum]|nr:hypothetical protein GGS24DRAFT_492865 [Hypoxylon argillaceum]
MQTKIIIVSLFLFVTKVLAGGYAGALERVWLFYAYQIDGLNDPADQTLGWKCKSWDPANSRCRTNAKGMEQWVKCPGTLPNKRCTFSQLLNFIGGADRSDPLVADSSGNPLPLTDTNPDPEETAKKVYAHFLAQPRPKVKDYPGYRIILNSDDNYVRNIRRVAKVVVAANASGKNNADTKWLFERFAETTTAIKTARVGDHGPYLIDGVRTHLNSEGYPDITVATQSVGPGHNPIDPAAEWTTVDWEKTVSNAAASKSFSSKWQVRKVLADVKTAVYRDQKANDHRVVIKSFRSVETKANGCI